MGVAATLVKWPRPCEQIFVPPSHWDSIWNLALIGPAVLEKKIFENGGRRMTDGPWLYYKLTNEPKGSGELIKWFAVYQPTHHFTHPPPQPPTQLFWSFLKKKKSFFLDREKKNISFLPSQPENSESVNSKQHIFKVGLI